MPSLQAIIENNFEKRQLLTPSTATDTLIHAVDDVIEGLDSGKFRVTEKINGQWVTHEWLKKAILLIFKLSSSQVMDAGFCQFYDKLPLKYANQKPMHFAQQGVRIVPHAIARRGAFIGKNTVLMPSYVNIGAYIGEGAMVDTWATVGSCAHIGNNVHLSGGVGIGGVLEPLQANPTIIEDNCFIGARSEIVEGVIVEEGSVISMGVYLSQSTKIYNRMTDEVTYGRIPAGSVVVPGSLPDKQSSCHLACAIIVKQVDEKTRAKTSINDLLRDH